MTGKMEQEMKAIAKAYSEKIGACLLYVNTDCAKFGVQLKSGDFKNIYFSDLKDLLKEN